MPPPPSDNHLIPDKETAAWADLGPRQVRGIVYHRLEGTLAGSDAFFRSGAPGLYDFGVGDSDGVLWQWNDPLSEAHPEQGVSANRSPFANGPVLDPSPDTLAFLAANDNDLNAINRDLVSITIAGFFDDPISSSCLETVATLSAYFASRARIPWDTYPAFPDQTPYSFVRWHNEIAADKLCPGRVFMNATPDIITLTQDILRQFQLGLSGA
jgi:hypothetical protein